MDDINSSKRGPKVKWLYSEDVADLICQKISEGGTLESICSEEGFPSRWVVSKWREENPEFNSRITLARQTRAEYFQDLVIEEARRTKTKDEVPAAMLLVGALKWAAQVGDPGTFGQKTKGIEAVAVQIVLDTGIRRLGDPGYNVDETEKLKARNPGSESQLALPGRVDDETK